MAAAAAAVDPSLEASFQASCEAVAALSVAVLDEKNPERDWHRWMQAILDAVATRPIFKAELEFTGALNAVVALTAKVRSPTSSMQSRQDMRTQPRDPHPKRSTPTGHLDPRHCRHRQMRVLG